ncbi:MAG TPA: phytanoyl-CoA dioxygenase family protein [Tepidisphaeraceae bacterium]|jgi:ectoine hydroxylase-related dioxygenase (phytanoyl-CoA dioxygenase family)
MTAADPAHVLDEEGFLLLKNVLEANQIDDLLAALGRRCPSHAVRNLLDLPEIRNLAISETILRLIRPHLGTSPFPIRGIYFDKNPSANWKVAWHQDITIEVRERIDVSGFGPWSMKDGVHCVQPPTEVLKRMLTIRLHLDACTLENGPLLVVPRSHQHGILAHSEILRMKDSTAPTPCVTDKGGALLMRPLLIHASRRSSTPTHRRIIHLDYAAQDLPEPLQWRAV